MWEPMNLLGYNFIIMFYEWLLTFPVESISSALSHRGSNVVSYLKNWPWSDNVLRGDYWYFCIKPSILFELIVILILSIKHNSNFCAMYEK